MQRSLIKYPLQTKKWQGNLYQIDFMGKDTKNTDMYASTGVMLRKFADIENENWADGVRHRGCILFRFGRNIPKLCRSN